MIWAAFVLGGMIGAAAASVVLDIKYRSALQEAHERAEMANRIIAAQQESHLARLTAMQEQVSVWQRN